MKLVRTLLGLAPTALLCGCVAALVPVLAGGALVKKQTGKRDVAAPQAAPAAKPQVTVLPAVEPDRQSAAQPVAAVSSMPLVGPIEGNPYAAFARFAVTHAAPPPAGETRGSALVDQDSIEPGVRLAACDGGPPAVVLDLDPGGKAFDPADPPRPAPGLAEQLAAIRGAGVTVLWAASTPVERAQEVYTVLRASGLDPDRTDRLLLPRNAGERKQTRRLAAARDWCVIAVAGDQRGDFDEVLDYLRDPEGPIARALSPTFGNGWFVVPTPVE